MLPTVLSWLIVYIVPLFFWMAWRRRFSARVFPLIAGMGAYILISLLRGVARIVVLNDDLKETPWLYIFTTAFLTGIFEETGRYIVFRFAIREYDRQSDCISYGIGHGAVEIILTQSLVENTLLDDFFVLYDLVSLAAFSAALSVLVFASVHYTENKNGLFAAIALHTAVDFTYVLDHYGIVSFGVVVLIQLAMTIGMCYLAYRILRHYKDY